MKKNKLKRKIKLQEAQIGELAGDIRILLHGTDAEKFVVEQKWKLASALEYGLWSGTITCEDNNGFSVIITEKDKE